MQNSLSKAFWAAQLFFLLLVLPIFSSPAHASPLGIGSGVFEIQETTGTDASPLRSYYHRPAGWADGDPIVIVFHGLNRNAKEYCDGWAAYADAHNYLIICPEFTQAKYPGVRYYNLGNVTDSEDMGGTIQPQDQWIFPVIDHVIQETKLAANAKKSKVILFAHSAGAQLIHRYILFGGDTNANLIIASNAGWYTMTDFDTEYPYGLQNVPVQENTLKKAFAKPVLILLGEQDVQRTKVLRKTIEADLQGQNRLERGKYFYESAKLEAEILHTPFNWKLSIVPNVGHDGVKMAIGAIPHIESL